MGDRTYHQGRLIASTTAAAEKVRAVIEAHGVDEISVCGRLIEYTIEEAYLGTTANEITPAVCEVDKDVAYYCWEDPKYEFLGQVVICDGTNTFWADCGTYGDPLLTYSNVEYATKHEGKTLDEAFGRPVIDGWNRAHDAVLVENGAAPRDE